MKNRMSTLIAGLALLGLGYTVGRFRNDTNIAHADETAKWTKIEFPLGVFHRESTATNSEYAWSEGFWQSTSFDKGRQVNVPEAVFIMCKQTARTCQESVAGVSAGLLQPILKEYDITSWTADGISADQRELCGVGYRLWLDFKGNSVIRTPYPMKGGGSCSIFHDPKAYLLRGEGLVLRPEATWDPLAPAVGNRLPGTLNPQPPGTRFPPDTQ
jgi:hypothetical protein